MEKGRKAPRWRPTLPHVRFGGRGGLHGPSLPLRLSRSVRCLHVSMLEATEKEVRHVSFNGRLSCHCGWPFRISTTMCRAISMVLRLLAASVVRTEATKGISGAGGSAAPYTALGHIFLQDLDGLEAAFQHHGARSHE